jgi:hypothetical protein
MTLLVCWLVFPLVLSVLGLGCGLLLERAAGRRLPGVLLIPAGLALVVVAAHLATATDATAKLAVPLVVVLAVAGIALSPPWRRGPIDWWAAGTAAAVFAVFAAPVVLSGQATVAGYLKLEDTATWIALTDRVMEHGRSLHGLAPSSYEGILASFLPFGYPIGALMPFGVGKALVGQDLAWLLQPYMAFLAAMLALSLYGLLAPLVRPRLLRAVVVAIASQSALLYGYSLWGGVKELAGAWLLALLAAVAALLIRDRDRIRELAPVAVVGAATLAVLSYGGALWIAAVLLPVLVAIARARGARQAALWTGAFIVLIAVLAIPSIVTSTDFIRTSPSGFRSQQELGALVKPLSSMQLFGIWPTGDFRLRPESMALTRVLFVIVLLSGLGGVAWAVLRRAWGVLIYVGAAIVITIVLAAQGAPWVDAKTFANTTPAFLLAGAVGAAALAPYGRRIEAGILLGAIAAGVLWSNALAYKEVDLAPRAQLAELQKIGDRIEGEGPTLMTEYMPYGVRHFLRKADPEGASLFRRRLVPLLNGQGLSEAQPYADIDRFRTSGILVYRTLVLRRSPAASRPPSPYKLTWHGRYYEVWQRPRGAPPHTIVDHLPLGSRLQASARPRCSDVTKLARRAGPGGRLAAVERPQASVVALARTSHSPTWLTDPNDPSLVFPSQKGSLTGQVSVPAGGRYGVWLGGSFRGRLAILVDARLVKADRQQLNHPDQYVPMGEVTLGRGVHTVQITYGGADLHPGSGGHAIVTAASPVKVPFPIGPLDLSRTTADSPIAYVLPARARSLCGKSLDWVEALRAGPGAG